VRTLPPAEFLRECFDYEPSTGELRWKFRPEGHFFVETESVRWNKRYAHKLAGCVAVRGYFNVGISGIRYQVHRVIWKLVTGDEPVETIDHIDGDTGNNRWVNLRLATMVEQGWNVRTSKANTSGHAGVYRRKNRWEAGIGAGGVWRYLGSFGTREDAATARNAAARKLHGEFYREPSP
jgi:hypothetical protein